MKELYDFTFSSINIIPTLFLIIVVMYWITVLIGVLDFNSLDFDVDAHTDIDVGVHADIDTHI